VADPRLDVAWETYRRLLDQAPPHEVTQQLRSLYVPDDVIAEMIHRHEIEATRFLALAEPLAVGRENAVRWYAGPRKGDRNWPAFRAHLLRSLDQDAVDKIDDASDKIVAMLDHPATPTFRSRGLVIGHVQSGKTSNFTAVICKAADRGYRMFIVLSGVHNALRRQTQSRLIRDVVALNPPSWHQITKPEHDFVPPANAASLLASKDQALLLVVKKNAVVLRKLRDWLEQAREHLENCPTLIIDDEADQATVATKTINPLIRDVLGRLPRVCYVGYTATPFANLLIDPANQEDFYPRDFILSLPRGDDYQGPETLFGRSLLDGEDPADVPGGLDMIRVVPDDEVASLRPERKADVPSFSPVLTASVRRAVMWFWLATAVRRVRSGEEDHSSMLIHAHSDVKVHDSYRKPLEDFRGSVVAALSSADDAVIGEFRALWEDESARVSASEMGEQPVHFTDLVPLLESVVGGTKVIMDHYRSPDRLDYEAGKVTVIAVGGNTLSRGLTLEGLVVSVFVRSSDVYDTLLQMGRWFGYRPGYKDLPRIYMPAEVKRWFTHLATVEAEMRLEIDRYIVEHKSPLELAVRIRCHPKMRVTGPTKQGSSTRAAAAYGGALVESRYFPCLPPERSLAWHDKNDAAVRKLLEAAEQQGSRDVKVQAGKVLWRNVPGVKVLDFVDDYRFHEMSTDASSKLMHAYIERRMASGALASWNVGVVGNPLAVGLKSVQLPADTEVAMVVRNRLSSNAGEDVADIKTLTGSRDEALDLTIEPGEAVNRIALQRKRVQQQAERGLILLYPIDADSRAKKKGRADLLAPGKVVWGAAFVFPNPSSGVDIAIEYDYLAADLSKVFPSSTDDEPEDASVLNQDLDGEDGSPA
jgi:hypothetical protein